MSELMASLIAKYEMGVIIGARPGLDLFWSGERIQIHSMIEGEHVWIEQNFELDQCLVGFGAPAATPWLTMRQARLLLVDHFGGVE